MAYGFLLITKVMESFKYNLSEGELKVELHLISILINY